jgi:quercetin dioxygenase-like cupin family protein
MRNGLATIHLDAPVPRGRWGLVCASLVLGWLTCASTTHAQKQEPMNTATIQQVERFQESTTVLDTKGMKRRVRASVRVWTILGDQTIPEFEEHSFLLVQLLGGKVTTGIDGKEQKRRKGEFWVLPSNKRMSIHTTGETTTLEVTVLSVS